MYAHKIPTDASEIRYAVETPFIWANYWWTKTVKCKNKLKAIRKKQLEFNFCQLRWTPTDRVPSIGRVAVQFKAFEGHVGDNFNEAPCAALFNSVHGCELIYT